MQVSVVISAYNVEAYIDKCLESLNKQTVKEFEVILINDGSSDNTGFKCRKWAEIDNRVQYYENEHLGVGKSKNLGIEKASGEYITIIDADDWVDDNYIEELTKNVRLTNADVVIADMYYVLADGEKLNYSLSKVRLDEGAVDLTTTLFLLSKCRTFLCGKLIKKRLFIDNDALLPNHPFEDISVCPFLMAAARKICYTSDTHYYYLRNRNTSIINTYSKLKYIKISLEELYMKFDKSGLVNKYDKELAYLFWGQVCHLWHITNDKFGDMSEAESNKLRREIINQYKEHFPKYYIDDFTYFTEEGLEKIALNLCVDNTRIVKIPKRAKVIIKYADRESCYLEENKLIYTVKQKNMSETMVWDITDSIFNVITED